MNRSKLIFLAKVAGVVYSIAFYIFLAILFAMEK